MLKSQWAFSNNLSKAGLNNGRERQKENKVVRGSDNPLTSNNSSNALTNKSATAATSDRTGHTFTTSPHPSTWTLVLDQASISSTF